MGREMVDSFLLDEVKREPAVLGERYLFLRLRSLSLSSYLLEPLHQTSTRPLVFSQAPMQGIQFQQLRSLGVQGLINEA